MAVGAIAWPNAAGGYACEPCKETATPTLGGVVAKIRPRIAAGNPVNLDLGDVGAVVEAARIVDDLRPYRRGDEQVWSDYRADYPREMNSEDLLGLATDALEYRFQPNLPTRPLVALLEMIDAAIERSTHLS